LNGKTLTMAGRDIFIINTDTRICSIQAQSASGLRGCVGSNQYLGLALASSGAVHLSAYLVVVILLGSSPLELIPPKSGRNSIELTLSIPTADTDSVESYRHLIPINVVQCELAPEYSSAAPDARATQVVHVPISRSQAAIERVAMENVPGAEERPNYLMTKPKVVRADWRNNDEATAVNDDSPVRHPLPRRSHATHELMFSHHAEAVAPVDSSRSSGAEVDALPQQVFSPPPSYPAAALQARQEGQVVLRVRVERDGRAWPIGILRSSGYDLLDSAAHQAVRNWRFEPARRAGIAVAMEVAIPIRFELVEKLK
jgi:protein TonB